MELFVIFNIFLSRFIKKLVLKDNVVLKLTQKSIIFGINKQIGGSFDIMFSNN